MEELIKSWLRERHPTADIYEGFVSKDSLLAKHVNIPDVGWTWVQSSLYGTMVWFEIPSIGTDDINPNYDYSTSLIDSLDV